MAVTHSATAKNSIANAILDDIDVAAAGYLSFETTGATEVSRHTFPTTCGTVTTDTLTFTCGTGGISDTSPTGGTVAQATIRTSADATILSCGVAVTGSDIDLSSLTIGTGDTVTLTALSYTAPS